MQKQLLIILCAFFISLASSQNEANIWYFGENAGLDFNSGTPVALLDGALNTFEGCSTISDENGSLLFYTDGTTVWNKNHIPMPNGTGLSGDSSSTQSAIIVPKPSDANIYYIFTVDNEGGPNGLQYSEVDMSSDSGLGDVTFNKNILLSTPVVEKISAVKSSTNNEFWVVAHRWNSNEFISFNVSNLGVDIIPVVSPVGSFVGGSNLGNSQGQLKVSPDGTKLVVVRGNNLSNVELFDFNSSNGEVSNPMTILDYPSTSSINTLYGVEFSSNSNVLYVSVTIGRIFQFNLNAGSLEDIINSQFEIITTGASLGALQLASDEKIYIAAFNSEYLGIIEQPNELGAASSYQSNGAFLGGRLSKLGLPPFIQSFFNVGFLSENYCLGDMTNFILNNTQPYDTLEWDFGDGTISTDENPTHIFGSAGDYNVVLTLTSGGETAIDTQLITINAQPTATQPQSIFVCDDNNDGFYSFNLTGQNSDILNGQDATQFRVDYYASAADYTTNSPIADYSAYINTTAYGLQEITASVKNNDNLDCEALTTFNIQVVESPLPNQNITPISSCDNTTFGTDIDGIVITNLTQRETDVLNGQSATDFTVTYYTDAAFTNQVATPTAYQNTNASETIFVLMENDNMAANCIADTSFQLEVLPLPTVTPIVNLSQCDDDTDGFSVFNLTEVYAELSSNFQNETITFHESELEAQNNASPITNETIYPNQTVSTDRVWARVESTNGCHRTAEVNLTVSTTQIPLNFTRNFYACDDVMNQQDGIATFDFSSVDTEIRTLFPVGQQLDVSYYRNEAEALAETDEIVDITNYRNVGYPNSQDIFVRVDSTLDNDCLGLGHHVTLNVDSVPLVTGPIIIEQCDASNDGEEAFNTSAIEQELLIGQTENIVFSYVDEFGMTYPSPLPNPLISDRPILNIFATMTVENPLNPNGGCSVQTTITLVIANSVTANSVPDFTVCDTDGDGANAFDTSGVSDLILNGQTDVLLTFRDEQGNNYQNQLPNPFITGNQTIIATVTNVINPFCFQETEINFIVGAVPNVSTIDNDFVCDDISNDGEELFTLSDYDVQVLGTQSSATFEIIYFDNLTDAEDNTNPLPNSYLVDVDAIPVFARIQARNNPDCFVVEDFEIGVRYFPIASQPQDIEVCDDIVNDGFTDIDLSTQNNSVLNGLNTNDFDVKYYLSMDNTIQDSNQISDDFTNTENPQTIYVRLENVISPDCFTITQFDIYVREQPVLLMDDLWPICEGGTLDIIADAGYDNYSWSNGEMTQIITVDTPQSLTVRAWNDYGNLICETEKTITVTQSNIATITNIETVDWTQTDNSITVTVTGNGDYEYSIDGITYQDSNIFSNLVVDEYTVYVRDKLGCGIVTETVFLLGAPRYFTPNGDGNHDTWQIVNGFTEPRNVIRIFDRYGKLLKQLSPTDLGWDGTYNGNMLPTSDYWFMVERQNGKTYTGHFTLKR